MKNLANKIKNRLYNKKAEFKEEIILGKKFQTKGFNLRRFDYDDGWLMALALKSSKIMDLGPNQGQSTLLMLYSEKVETIFLVEPNPQALTIAAEHLIYNHLSEKARLIPAFISNKDEEEIPFYTVGAGAAGSFYRTHAKSADKSNSSFMVRTLTIDNLSDRFNFLPDLVKIDIEGAEHLALEGAKKLARKEQTKFIVEMHDQGELTMFDNAQLVYNWCQQNNYNPWYLKEKQLLTDPAQIQHRGRCHLLLIPKNWDFPDYLQNIPQSVELDNLKELLPNIQSQA